MGIKTNLKKAARFALPLDLRKRIAAWMNCQRWLPARDYWSMGIIRDLQASDPKAFHKFVWAHHMAGYARWYNSKSLFGANKMNGSVQTFRDFFDALTFVIQDLGLNPSKDIRSALEIGCSLGYLLRILEKDVFPESEEVVGIDIDRDAIDKGAEYLASVGSNVRLIHGDMEELDRIVGRQKFDFTLASGVLSYLDEMDAAKLISKLLVRTNRVLGLVGLACQSSDNRDLERSHLSTEHNNQWIHNFDAFVEKAGGKVVRRRWEESGEFNNQTPYFVFAVPK
jgi:SAM-dependent methyltransferase